MKRLAFILAGCLATAIAAAEVVDNCASLLGSIGVELRYARQLPSSARTTFLCPRDTRPLVGASRQRILAALGTPDATASTDAGGMAWSYFFGPRPAPGSERPGHQPELRFEFDLLSNVQAIRCQQRH